MEKNCVYHADCMEMLRELPDRSVDLVIADPPYYRIESMRDTLLDTISDLNVCDTELEGYDDVVPMYVATNTTKLNGAAVVLYENQLRKFAKCFGGDYFLLPSSIHETLLIPVTNKTNALSDLKEMVVDVNKTCVTKEEFLSDSVYRYFVAESCLKIVA